MLSVQPTEPRGVWSLVAVALLVSLVVTELVLGTIKNHWGGVTDRVYVVVFAVVSVCSLVLSFFAIELARDLHRRRMSKRASSQAHK